MLKQITPALVLDKHMIPCRDENEKRLLYAYLSKKRELAEHLSQIIYVLENAAECDKVIIFSRIHAVCHAYVADMVFWKKFVPQLSRMCAVSGKP